MATPRSLLDTLRHAAAALRESGVPHVLAGGFAVHAWGGPPSDHDVDFLVRSTDVGAALDCLEATGMRREQPPEDWLVKAWDGSNLVDLIIRPAGIDVDDELLAHAVPREVGAVTIPVLPPTDLLVLRALALSEHHCDLSPLLTAARAMRERVDWTEVVARSAQSPFAAGFLTVVQQLGIADSVHPDEDGADVRDASSSSAQPTGFMVQSMQRRLAEAGNADASIVVQGDVVVVRGVSRDPVARARALRMIREAFPDRRVRDQSRSCGQPEVPVHVDDEDIASGGSGTNNNDAQGARNFPDRPDAPAPRGDGLPRGHPAR